MGRATAQLSPGNRLSKAQAGRVFAYTAQFTDEQLQAFRDRRQYYDSLTLVQKVVQQTYRCPHTSALKLAWG